VIILRVNGGHHRTTEAEGLVERGGGNGRKENLQSYLKVKSLKDF